MNALSIILQLLVALTLLNVWILRRGKVTSYRGGDAENMREEFAAFGLPYWFMCLIGTLEVILALALLVGIWIPVWAKAAAALEGVLMIGALAMHTKVSDPVLKSLPAVALLLMCVAIVLL